MAEVGGSSTTTCSKSASSSGSSSRESWLISANPPRRLARAANRLGVFAQITRTGASGPAADCASAIVARALRPRQSSTVRSAGSARPPPMAGARTRSQSPGRQRLVGVLEVAVELHQDGGEVVVRLTDGEDLRRLARHAVLQDQARLDDPVPDVALQLEAGVDRSAVGTGNAAVAAERDRVCTRAT